MTAALMPRFDRKLDAIIIPDGTCPGCQIQPAGPANMGGFCDNCRTDVAGSIPQVDLEREARQEMAERELCRRRLLPYIKRIVPNYMAGWFHVDLAARLERFSKRVMAEESPRMIINVPPRRGKSEQASKGLPAWHLGKHGDQRIIAATHSDRLAIDNSRDVLNYMRSPRHVSVFPDVVLDKDNKGAMGWRTNQGGMYKPAGVGAGIAGYGANILIIDDPHRDKDAYSMVVRDSIFRWYKSTARTRLMPGGGVILVQTRWVNDDLTGRVIEEDGLIEDGGLWELVVYPEQAEFDEYRLPNGVIVRLDPQESGQDDIPLRAKLLRKKGEFLHPERYPKEMTDEVRQDPVTWQALYQQNPTGGDSAQFTDEMLELSACTMADIPDMQDLTRYTTWDTAQTLSQINDFCAGMTGGVDAEHTLWIIDLVHERLVADDLIERILDQYELHGDEVVGIEKTQFVVGLQSSLNRRIDERRLHHFPMELLEHGNKDKVARSKPIQSWMRRGKVKIPTDAPWFLALKEELRAFPGGKHDDQVDVLAYLGQLLDDMTAPFKGRSAPRKKSWRDSPGVKAAIQSGSNRNWRTA